MTEKGNNNGVIIVRQPKQEQLKEKNWLTTIAHNWREMTKKTKLPTYTKLVFNEPKGTTDLLLMYLMKEKMQIISTMRKEIQK